MISEESIFVSTDHLLSIEVDGLTDNESIGSWFVIFFVFLIIS